jgi:non-ribosomal peptide synthetase component F
MWYECKENFNIEKGIHSYLEDIALRYPQNTALVFHEYKLSFSELNNRANQFANYLLYKGLKPNSCVGVCMDRGFELVIVMLGIMKTGCAYVPMRPDHPFERLFSQLSDSSANFLITSQEFTSKFYNLEHRGQVLC